MNEDTNYSEFFEELGPLLLRAGYEVTYGHFVQLVKTLRYLHRWHFRINL